MKKLLLAVLGLAVLAVPAYAENKIQMVTYFPVPYVAYSKINIAEQLDVGLTTAEAQLKVGISPTSSYSLEADQVVLQNGTLYLRTGAITGGYILTPQIQLGTTGSFGAASLDFNKNLRVQGMLNGYTIQADTMNVNKLLLFGNYITNEFPSCTAAGGSGTVRWKELTLRNTSEVYLVCE